LSDHPSARLDPVAAAFAQLATSRPSADLHERILVGVASTAQPPRSGAAARVPVGAAAGVVAMGAIAVGGGWVRPQVTSPPSPRPADSAFAPSSSAATPSPSQASASASRYGTVARANGEISITAVNTVHVGQKVLVMPGPVDHGGVPSYRLQFFGDLNTGYLPGGVSGWISVVDARRYLDEHPPSCPDDPTRIADVAALQPFERPVCFGSRDLTFEPIAARERSYGPPISDRWISSDGEPDFFTGLPVYGLTPDLSPNVVLPDTGWYRVSGHFDDPSSLACGAGDDVKVAWCRERFVITAVTAVDPPSFVLEGSWRQTAIPPIDGRTEHAMAWTGTEAVVWGGVSSSEAQSAFDAVARRDGAAYNPTTDHWRVIPAAPIAGRSFPVMAWTGSEVVVFGGMVGERGQLDGAAWNPATNGWRTIAGSPLKGTSQPIGAWLDGRLYVVNDASAAAYDPAADRWTALPPAPIRPGWRTLAVAAGRVFLIAFGDGATPPVEWAVLDPVLSTWRHGEAPIDPLMAGSGFVGAGEVVIDPGGGEVFDPVAAAWSTIPRCDGAGEGSVWTGSVVLGIGGAWDTRTEQCLQVPPAPPREPPFDGSNGREFAAGVWTGRQYITWSGGTGGDIVWVPKDGAVFTPANDLGPCCG
jgi:hypothetical protein